MSSILGLPLEYCLEILNDHNMVVDWIDFIESSLKHGWKISTTLIRVETAVTEIYGKEYSDQVLKRLNFYTSLKNLS